MTWREEIIDYIKKLPEPDQVKFLRDDQTKLVDAGDGHQLIKTAEIKVIEIWYKT